MFRRLITRNERRAHSVSQVPLPARRSQVREIGHFTLEPLLVFRIAPEFVGDCELTL